MIGCCLSPSTIPHPLHRSRSLFIRRPAVIVACRRTTIVAVVIDPHHAFAAPADGCRLFVVSPPLCSLPLSSICMLSSSIRHVIVEEEEGGQSRMHPLPISAEMEPALIRRRLVLCLALLVACQQAASWSASPDGEQWRGG